MSDVFMHKIPAVVLNFCHEKYGFKGLCFMAEENGSSVKLQNVAGTYQTSADGKTWNDYILGTPINLNQGQKVYFAAKTTNETCWNDNYDSKFKMTGKIKASGNIQSLLDKECERTDVPQYCYHSMFKGCTSLVRTPLLPAVTLTSGCYNSMFSGCTSLVQAPQLPATTLADSCYNNMFYNCTSLAQAPELPAVTLANACYHYMFFNCTSLTKVPELPATTLADYCYMGMFCDCASLTHAPVLPAAVLVSCCYRYMFTGCTSLVQTTDLPATTLANSCYSYMFAGCTSLVQATDLPATTLANECYYSMFYSCTLLKISENTEGGTKVLDLPATTTAAQNWNTNMFKNTAGTFKGSPSIGKTYRCYQ